MCPHYVEWLCVTLCNVLQFWLVVHTLWVVPPSQTDVMCMHEWNCCDSEEEEKEKARRVKRGQYKKSKTKTKQKPVTPKPLVMKKQRVKTTEPVKKQQQVPKALLKQQPPRYIMKPAVAHVPAGRRAGTPIPVENCLTKSQCMPLEKDGSFNKPAVGIARLNPDILRLEKKRNLKELVCG